ncbi:glutamate-rich protein 5 isoform X2 [Anas platyrhynchos]|uniref:glutamate-rich protein 5 isoform X2 n=1 Tax=Anas platyrhynchos TaxID=8839 RepID=UPI000F7C28F3|nr:glutamate-rich protein 5 isoform X2 [Anas platyrhynchos]|eukprot:XP_027308305.1 glutamate-rich protein 5 isoform X2 [Anas platyrhynchos]
MGCSSSARSRPQEHPTGTGEPLRASPGENTPTADDYETIADQTQLGLAEVVSLASEETNPGECLPGDKDEAVSPAEEEKISSVQDREEPEGTEPLPVGSEESSELPSVWREESTEPSPPPTPAEDAGSPPPDPSEDSGLVEGSDSSVVEIVNKVHVTEEDHFIEGETGEQVETELLSEIVSGGPETKEEETGEAVDGAAATEIETANNKE